jgi:hypothetical protein
MLRRQLFGAHLFARLSNGHYFTKLVRKIVTTNCGNPHTQFGATFFSLKLGLVIKIVLIAEDFGQNFTASGLSG